MVEIDNGVTASMPERVVTKWKSKENGQIFNQKDFTSHHKYQKWKIIYKSFLYGLIYCFFYGLFNTLDSIERRKQNGHPEFFYSEYSSEFKEGVYEGFFHLLVIIGFLLVGI